jgi:hypothetical protein
MLNAECCDQVSGQNFSALPRSAVPAPNWEVSHAPPSMVTSFINTAICISAVMGLLPPGKLCITSVTGTRKPEKGPAARHEFWFCNPGKVLSPPASLMQASARRSSLAFGAFAVLRWVR